MDPVSTVNTAVPHFQDAGHSNCGATRSDANNRVIVPEAGSAVSVKVRDSPGPLEVMEAAGGLGAGLLSPRGMTSLCPQEPRQLNPYPIPEDLKSHRYIAPKKQRRLHRLPPETTKTTMIYQPPLNLT